MAELWRKHRGETTVEPRLRAVAHFPWLAAGQHQALMARENGAALRATETDEQPARCIPSHQERLFLLISR